MTEKNTSNEALGVRLADHEQRISRLEQASRGRPGGGTANTNMPPPAYAHQVPSDYYGPFASFTSEGIAIVPQPIYDAPHGTITHQGQMYMVVPAATTGSNEAFYIGISKNETPYWEEGRGDNAEHKVSQFTTLRLRSPRIPRPRKEIPDAPWEDEGAAENDYSTFTPPTSSTTNEPADEEPTWADELEAETTSDIPQTDPESE